MALVRIQISHEENEHVSGAPNREVTVTPIPGVDGVIRYHVTLVGEGTLSAHGMYDTLESALDSFDPPLSERVRSHVVEGVRCEGKAVMFYLEDSFEKP